MNIEKVVGLCFIGTALFTAVGFLIHPHNYSSDVQAFWLFGHGMIFFGLVLNLLGFAWLYSKEHANLGLLGLFGFIATTIGLTHYIGKLYWSGFLYPLVFTAHPEFISNAGLGPGNTPNIDIVKIVYFSGALLFAVGVVSFISALIRTRNYPNAPLVFVMAGAVLVGVWPLMPDLLQMLSPIVSAIYAIGIFWIGVLLIREN